jgi:uncharacterized damage-inducible protein DinB
MPPMNELDRFRTVWDIEAELTTKLLEALPTDQYECRPDPGGRSLGEMAWHLSEIEGYISYGITKGAVARLEDLTVEDLDRELAFVTGPLPIRDILWGTMLMHQIHHRGQLSLLCRLAGGTSPGIYGPNREEMAAMRERMRTAKV